MIGSKHEYDVKRFMQRVEIEKQYVTQLFEVYPKSHSECVSQCAKSSQQSLVLSTKSFR